LLFAPIPGDQMRRLKMSLTVVAAAVFLIGSVPAAASPVTTLTEGFDNINQLTAAGWVMINNSSPLGSTNWFQGVDGILPAQGGASDSYIAANFNNAEAGGDISNWILTPELEFGVGTNTASFWTIVDNLGFGDSIEMRLSFAGPSTDVGGTTTSVGVFTTSIVIPMTEDWRHTTLTLINGGSSSLFGRIAFRYVVSDTSVNGDYIGIDTFSFRGAETTPQVPEPMSLTLLGTGLAGLALRRRRRA